MSPDDLAALHRKAMVHASPWTAKAFAEMLASSGAFLITAPASSWQKYRGGGPQGRGQSPGAPTPGGALLGRVTGHEAELLTLAVDPAVQRSGVGRSLLEAFERRAIEQGATEAFLEVAEDNSPALALYLSTGWQEAGRRPGYYPRRAGEPANALILRKSLKSP